MMAQVISTICDECSAPAVPLHLTFRFPGEADRSVIVDLCETHRAGAFAALARLAEIGRPDGVAPHGRASVTVKPEVCPLCGSRYKNRGSLSAHLRKQHGQTLGETERDLPTERTHKCPLCSETFAKAQGLGRHVKAIHGQSLPEARLSAERASTPPEAPEPRRRRSRASDEA